MQNKLVRLASKLTTAAMVVSMFAMSMPANAAVISASSDQMSALIKSATGVTHNFSFTLATGMVATDTLTITMPAGAGQFAACNAAGVTPWANTTVACSGQNLVVTATGVVAAGAKTLNGATWTNPTSAGSYTLSLAQTGGDTGSIVVAIVDNDTIHVTANISQVFIYDIMTAASCATSSSSADYAIDLGTLTPDTAKASSAVSEYICQKLVTNAQGGAVVEVKDAHAGLVSDVDSTVLDSATEDLATGGADKEGFGLCGGTNSESGVDGAWTQHATWVSACSSVGALTTSFVEIANTGTNAITGGTAASAPYNYDALVYQVAARATTSSTSGTYHDDITFRAYATF